MDISPTGKIALNKLKTIPFGRNIKNKSPESAVFTNQRTKCELK